MNNNTPGQMLAAGAQPTLGDKLPDPMDDIDVSALIDEHKRSRQYVEAYTRDFPQLDDIVDAVPLNVEADMPYVADTTASALVNQLPKDSLQQMPVFGAIVNGTKWSIQALICTALLQKYVFNEDTFGKGLLSTMQLGMKQAITRGYAPFMVGVGSMFNDFGTTMRLLHYLDTAPEPGISDHNETGYDFTVAHLTPTRVRKILKQAQNNPNTSWNAKALQEVLASPPQPSAIQQWQSAVNKNVSGAAEGPTYEFVTYTEVGPNSQKITFCPNYSQAPLRVIENRSKWGYPQVMYLVIDPAALSPFGTSRVRVASPNINLLNIYYGNIAAMLIINSKPPLLKRGRFTGPIQLKQGVVWESRDPNSNVEMKNLDNGALQSFPQMAAALQSQIQNIIGGQTASVGPGSKNSAFGKTGPGEKRSQQFVDSATNQLSKLMENFIRQYALVALDTLFAEQEGTDLIIIPDEIKDQINQIEPGAIGDDNTFEMHWEDFYAGIKEWSIEVLVSISKDELKDQQFSDLQDMLVVLAQNAPELGQGAIDKINEISDMLLKAKAPLASKAGRPMLQPGSGTMPTNMAGDQSQGQQGGQGAVKPPSMSVNYKDAPDDIKRQMEAADGFTPSRLPSPVTSAQPKKQPQPVA